MLRRLGPSLAAVVAATAFTGLVPDAAEAAPAPAARTLAPPRPHLLPASAPDLLTAPANAAHRGASASAPENTVAAFRLARTHRADLFELDVQQTRDRKLVLMHDITLARTTNVEQVFPHRSPWRVRDFTLAEIRRLDAGSWFAPKYRGERVPTLGETLKTMRGSGLGLLLEVKSPELYPGVEQRIAGDLRREPSWLRPDPRERRLVVQSFDWNSMRSFHRVLPAVPIGLLGTPKTAQLPGLAKFADQINPPYTGLTASYVDQVHRYGMDVLTWTVDDPAKMRRAVRLGVDGVITNKPATLAKVLREKSSRDA
ncbi:glycerophosphodiester phosphodiesterase [Actinomadura hibisca]|uniref:glycerophosphodiester phosphodiesterase n=1 Tax=Actinomadura hibisca TaxID=68565 RepID=UPI000833F462|nr:glycerophosphodiester phosphodiesterase family protein [Actinomadura hibisca]